MVPTVTATLPCLESHCCILDDIADIINNAKRTSASANDTANDALDKLKKLQSEIDNITVPQTDSFDDILKDVDQSGKCPDWLFILYTPSQSLGSNLLR